MNKKRQFLKGLWPFCMIKINLKIWSFCMIKRDRGLVAIIEMQNDPFFNSLWPFCMIKINLALINLVILHLYRIERSKFSTMQKNRANTFTKNRANTFTKKRRDLTAQLELGFLLGPTPPFFSTEWVVGEQPSTTNRIASRGSPHDPTMRSRPCDPTARSLHAACPPNSF